MQKQIYRWTDCVCIIDSYWDFLGLIIIVSLAMYGMLMLAYQYRRDKKNKKK